jgi:hypothetical protein
LWTNTLGARVFAVDDQTNVYANAAGAVIIVSGAGQPLQTNRICPLPSIAQRDAAGNYLFAGSFDGTQDFGGITLVGGCTICSFNGHWTPGWPTCFLAKYDAEGALQWAKSFGQQGRQNILSDLVANPNRLLKNPRFCDLSNSQAVNRGFHAWQMEPFGNTISLCCFT